MQMENQELVQLLNTAIVKSKEKKIDSTYERRLSEICKQPAVNAIAGAISTLADSEKISRDHAAVQIVETLRELDSIWNNYVMMEGLGKLKELLKDPTDSNSH